MGSNFQRLGQSGQTHSHRNLLFPCLSSPNCTRAETHAPSALRSLPPLPLRPTCGRFALASAVRCRDPAPVRRPTPLTCSIVQDPHHALQQGHSLASHGKLCFAQIHPSLHLNMDGPLSLDVLEPCLQGKFLRCAGDFSSSRRLTHWWFNLTSGPAEPTPNTGHPFPNYRQYASQMAWVAGIVGRC